MWIYRHNLKRHTNRRQYVFVCSPPVAMSRVFAQLKKSKSVFNTVVRSKSDGHHPSYKPLTMDDMPVPKVPWQEYHGKTNVKYNLILVSGFVAFASSIYVLQKNCFFNAFVPPYPFEDGQK